MAEDTSPETELEPEAATEIEPEAVLETEAEAQATPESEAETPSAFDLGAAINEQLHGKKAAEKKPAGEKPGDPKQPSGEKPPEKKPAKADHINDPIDKALSERTQERIRSLIDTVKQREEDLKPHQDVVRAIQDTGATADQFGYMLGYMKLVHSQDPEHWRLAAKALQNELRAISIRLGEPLDGFDVMREHPDLQKELAEGKLTPQRAREIAFQRSRTADQTEATKRTTEQQKLEAQNEQARQSGITSLNDLEKELVKRDGADVYKRLYDLIVTDAMKETFTHIHPNQWRAVFLRHYDALKASLPTNPAAPNAERQPNGQFKPQAVKSSPQPQRQKTPAGGTAAAPKNLFDAISGALDEVTRK